MLGINACANRYPRELRAKALASNPLQTSEREEQAFRLRANAPRGKRALRGLRGGKVSKSLDSLTNLKVSKHTLSPLVPLVPLVPLSFSWRSLGAQL